ncbi:hypothetical protein [Streptomyces tsukubensis]|uniref:Uncharacterized protein n=1 Tax=Streptomyces tsukubensis TaxID=83656 RepID=A0A1V4ABL6_9ACTN|nr:hypothetical protein [Streptomyces tsukubensis]OON81268.1 hypothetical protein B1H18_07870 [Streptomyces tsukubensis]QFR95620.1 hypothetical protein GBW32_24580 [Streptomyces tsukubensis]
MISITVNTSKVTDLSVVATCLLGNSVLGTGMSGVSAERSVSLLPLSGVSIPEREERPNKAPEAAVAAAQAQAYAFAAAGAGAKKQTKHNQHHTMWAFRGLEPWSDPA